MDRKTMQIINSDREIVELRMQSEDLINNIDNLSHEDFEKEANRIKEGIDQRTSLLLSQYKDAE